MHPEQKKQIEQYFAVEIDRCARRAKELTADDRGDEAVFEKVRMNVFSVIQTLFTTALQIAGGDEDRARRFFLDKTETVPENWRLSLQKAESHGDREKAYLESVKLETAAEARSTVLKLWGERP